MPLLRRLSVDRESGTTLAVLVEDSGNPLIKTARDQGARVVLVDLDQTDILRGLLTSRGTFKIRSFYAVSPDVAENLRWAAQLRAVADSSKPTRGDMAPRMVVRIDDPWQAEYWRRTNAYRTGKGRSVRWMSDALSVYEVTASVLLDRILDPSWEHAFDQTGDRRQLRAGTGRLRGAGPTGTGRCHALAAAATLVRRSDLVRSRGRNAPRTASAAARSDSATPRRSP